MMNYRILIIEDDEIMRITLEDSLKTAGYKVFSCKRGTDGINALKKDELSLIITDVRLPDMTGLNILEIIRDLNENIPVIMMTAFGTIKDAVEAMKLGAFDYITKPFSLDEFHLIVKRALEVKALREDNIRLRRDLHECYGFPNIIGESLAMKKIYELMEIVANTDSTILILGENGTGKELIASTIHYQGSRKLSPLIKVNCAALPENLVESELFGYEKGAFTGAEQKKIGRFERADRGTIFLDEIGDLPASVQIKLLRVLQDGSFERLGATETLRVNVRVIAATNKDLHVEIKEGRFREDLYYRLNVIPILMPALRERIEDIPLLLNHYLEVYNNKFGKKTVLSSDAVTALMNYDFPGNVRELENILERCVSLSPENVISKYALPEHIVQKHRYETSKVKLSEVAAEAEKEHIIAILKSTKGNKTRTAEILGISRKNLWEKLKTYNIKL